MQNVSDKPATEAWRFTMASTSAAVRTCPHDGMVILIGVLSRARHGEATHFEKEVSLELHGRGIYGRVI